MRSWLMLGLLFFLEGCQGPNGVPKAPLAPSFTTANLGDQVLAEVDDTEITLDEVKRIAGDRPLKEALEEAIRIEVLANRALHLKLDQDPEVVLAKKSAMVRAYLQGEFEPSFTPAQIPDEVLQKAYEMNKALFNHPVLFKVNHILVPVQRDDPQKKREQAQALAMTIGEQARELSLSPEEFAMLPDQYSSSDLAIRHESLPLSPGKRWVEEFTEAALSLTKVGEISPVVETSFGYHVIYLVKRQEARSEGFEEAREEVREKVFPELQAERFLDFLGQVRAGHHVETNGKLLEARKP